MATKTSEFDRNMRTLEAELRRLEAEYNMFFAGRLPRLPWETRARVEAMVKRFDRMHTQNTAERFRFNTLQARFVSFCELWDRSLRAKEEGRTVRGRARKSTGTRASSESAAATPPEATDVIPSSSQEPTDGVVHVTNFRDPSHEADRLNELYARLSEARAHSGEREIPFERFVDVVRAQVNKLGKGQNDVAFEVKLKHGKVTLEAKPLKDDE
ncbi:MAG TPA: hypothetical protein VEK56_03115 [Vicinamibacterales bacterium]|nr:hypothetical protein [Vicinamibacterales bacterium]